MEDELVRGSAPDKVRGAFGQRSRWCKGPYQVSSAGCALPSDNVANPSSLVSALCRAACIATLCQPFTASLPQHFGRSL